MRACYIFMILFFTAFTSHGQLRPKVQEVATRYFISLPYGQEFRKWVSGLDRNRFVLKDSAFHFPVRGLIYGAHLAQRKPFVETDTARIWITKQLTQFLARDSSGKLAYLPGWVYILNQEYIHLKETTTEKEWKSILKVVMNDFRKNSYVTYVGSGKITTTQRMWIGNSAQEEPMIEIQYGFNTRQKCYFIRLRMYFAIEEGKLG